MSEARKQQQVDYLKHQIDTGAAEAKSYLDKLKKGIYEYDQKHPSAQKATDALCSGLDAAEASVEELAHVGAKMTAQAKEKSDQSMELARETLQKVKTALHALQDKAREYDAKFADSTGAKVMGDVSDTVESIVNSMRQRTTDAIDKATEEMSHMKDSAQNAAGTMGYGVQVAAGEALRVGDMVDAKLGVTEKASGAAGAIAETVKSIDQRMHVTETAAAIDSKVTGGLGARVVTRGVEMVQESIEYVTETLQQAKIAASKSGTAQSAEQQASSAIDSASATADAAKVQATAAKDQAINTANNALDRTMEVAGAAQIKAYDATNQAIGAAYNARDKTMEMAGQATNTALGAAGLMTDEVKQGASNAKATVSDTAEAAKQGAHNMTANAQQKGSEMRASANKGAANAKQAAHETARSAKDTAQDAADATEQKGREWTGAGSRSSGAWGHESSGPGVVDSAKQTAQSAKDTVVDAATRAKDATVGSGSNSSSGTSHHTHRVDDYDLHVGAKNPRTNKVVIEVNAPGVSK